MATISRSTELQLKNMHDAHSKSFSFLFFLQHCNYDESFLGLLSASFFSQSATAVFAGNVVCLVYCIIATTANINLIKVL